MGSGDFAQPGKNPLAGPANNPVAHSAEPTGLRGRAVSALVDALVLPARD